MPRTDSLPKIPSPELVVTAHVIDATCTFSTYISHFPSSWALPTSPSPSPSLSPHSLAPFTSMPRISGITSSVGVTNEWKGRYRNNGTAAWCGPQSRRTSKRRNVTTYDPGSQIAPRQQRQPKAQSFSTAPGNASRSENLKRSLSAQLPYITRDSIRKSEREDYFNGAKCVDSLGTLVEVGARSDSASLGMESSEVASDCRSDEGNNNWYEDGYGDVPHRALAISDAYSTRTLSSVMS
ncbi:hypothetical protein AOQ84DRAFT_362866 [Glonium stellatum]|uniref:Uncharacterized protein n=1 Tax=Glonium stellatum TaxID=574774 RepID=A0A8E2F3H2_9PEZI|nr:hypothetical protein AOQ84DRAFT_362866 [Glonium stellatum]